MQSNPDGRFSGESSRQRSGDEDGRSEGRSRQSETQRCVSKYLALDRNEDGVLTAREYDRVRTVARDVDRNDDGKIDRSEIQRGCAGGVLTERDIKG
jgi:hypothetical protein